MSDIDMGVSSQPAASPCMDLVELFKTLNNLKAAEAEVCKEAGLFHPTLVKLCLTKPHTDALDRYALCKLLCCCNKETPPGVRKQDHCVDPVLNASTPDFGENYFKVKNYYYTGTEPYNLNGKDYNFGDLFPGPREGAPTRSPDVVVVKDPSLPAVGDNIQKVYEMKFGQDDYSRYKYVDGHRLDKRSQKDVYDELFDDKIDDAPLSDVGPNQCDCSEDGEKELEGAKKWLDEANNALNSAPTWTWPSFPGTGGRTPGTFPMPSPLPLPI